MNQEAFYNAILGRFPTSMEALDDHLRVCGRCKTFGGKPRLCHQGRLLREAALDDSRVVPDRWPFRGDYGLGRDIHAHVEVFDDEIGAWVEMCGLPEWDRYHRVFDILAGANGKEDEFPPIAKPRGLPADLSQEAQTSYDDDVFTYGDWGLHHVGYLSVEEMLAYDWWQHGYMTEWFHDDYLPRLERLGPPDKVRLIFWFDN